MPAPCPARRCQRRDLDVRRCLEGGRGSLAARPPHPAPRQEATRCGPRRLEAMLAEMEGAKRTMSGVQPDATRRPRRVDKLWTSYGVWRPLSRRPSLMRPGTDPGCWLPSRPPAIRPSPVASMLPDLSPPYDRSPGGHAAALASSPGGGATPPRPPAAAGRRDSAMQCRWRRAVRLRSAVSGEVATAATATRSDGPPGPKAAPLTPATQQKSCGVVDRVDGPVGADYRRGIGLACRRGELEAWR